jgi:glutamate/tyrosine decarboxylase-like PLP-dependent enzyme
MTSEIRRLEARARLLDPDADERGRLLAAVVEHTNRYLAGIATAPANGTRPDNSRALLDSPIAEEGIGIAEALALLGDNVDAVGVNTTSGRYLGYIPGGGLFHAALGDYMAAIANRYAGLFFACPGAVRIENMLLRWMSGEVGYPASAAGNLTSGGSLANLAAVVAARDACEISGDVAGSAVVYSTEHTHHCVDKALHVAGLGRVVKRRVGVDANYRMQASDLRRAVAADRAAGLRPWLLVASAGTVNAGSVDPLAELGEVAAELGLWFHVDGAYGGLFALCPEGRAVLGGIELSDSLVLDPHKSLFLPYGTGTVLVKDRRKLHAAFNAEADYIEDLLGVDEEPSPADLSPELTKHFRGLRLWLPLKLVGVAPFRAALSEKIHLARYFHERLTAVEGFEVGPPPDLSVVTYRYVPRRGDADEFNHRLMHAVQREGRVFVSSTRVGGRLVLRAAVLSFRTHLDEIDEALDALQQTALRLERD